MLKLPTHIQLEITDSCNLSCEYCYHFNTNEMPKSNDLDDDKIIQLVQKMVDAKIYSLVITGGEPLIRPDLTIKVVEIAKKAGMFVSINTNLLLITPEVIERLKELAVDSLLVSCPASDRSIYRQITRCGDYDLLYSKLKLLLSANIPCMVNMVVTPINYLFIKDTAAEMSKIGVKRFSATPASLNVEFPNYQELLNEKQTIGLLEDLRWCSEELGLEVDMLEPLPKCFFPDWCWEKDYAFTKRACQAGRMSVSISNIGDIRPCSHNPIVYGNLFQDNLEAIWHKMNIYRNGVTPDLCKHCPIVLSCNGACRTNSLAKSGLLNQPDNFIVGHFNFSQIKHSEIVINNDSVVYFKGNFRWRKEFENYSISSKSSAGNLLIVNEEMFNFVQWLEKSLPLSIEELIKNGTEDSSREAFIKIIEALVRRGFIYLA